jgi:hypothetical protein
MDGSIFGIESTRTMIHTEDAKDTSSIVPFNLPRKQATNALAHIFTINV